MESITLGGGCFWCLEAVFQNFRGVAAVESGYAGGKVGNPAYEHVSSGDTGHAEVVRVTFDPAVISLEKILTIFFHAHDPTTKDRQGNDFGTQYRSAIFFGSAAQRDTATKVRDEIARSGLWGKKELATEITALDTFYRAEEYHQNYYRSNPTKGYCLIVIGPKVQKIRKEFKDLLADPSAEH